MKGLGWTLGIGLMLLFASTSWAQSDVISEINVQGNRRIPAETVKARIFTHPGDIYDPAALERDFNSLWNTGYFEDIRFSREETPKGWRLIIQVKEKPTIREINYVGLSSVSTSDVLDRFKEAKVGLSVESQYDPTKVKKAEVTIKGLLAEHGRQFSTVRTEIRQIPPAAIGVTFVIKEGPKVKVGKIKFEGNKNVKSRVLRYAMKNLRPIGIPHSIFLEGIFARTYDATTSQTSSYLVSITAKVVLTAHDGRVLYRNDSILYREQFQSTQDLSSFIQEDGYAVHRVAREFAQTIVSDMLESF